MDFINGFLDKLGKNEAASLRDADGDPNKKCIERIQNAVFAKVYGSSTLVELQAESAKPKIRNVLKALNSCAGDFAQVKEHDDLDVVPDMMEALEYYLANKDQSKAEMEHTLKNAQSLNFTGDTPTFKTDHAVNMILAIADRAGSRNRLENVFRAISNEIKNEVSQRENPEVDMFSGPYQAKNKEQVVKQALDKVGREDVQKAMRTSFDHTFRNYQPGVWLLRKSHIHAYTRKDGTLVQEHEDSRQERVDTSDLPLSMGAAWTDLNDKDTREYLLDRAKRTGTGIDGLIARHQLDKLHNLAHDESNTAKHDTTVYFALNGEMFDNMKLGETFAARGARSTTEDPERAKRYGKNLFLVNIPKGSVAIFDPHHIAYTRTNRFGTVSQIKAKGVPRPEV